MDSYREHPSDFDLPTEDGADREVVLGAGGDERRMHVRAYNYWVSLLDGRDFPSIEDLEPQDLNDFSGNSVLLDFTCGRDNPATPYIGPAIREECGLSDGIRTISEVPSRSLLSRLTDHYMQIIANRAPVGFEAEFENQRGESICYRGILMPFSSDGDTIDFIYGVINWKRGESPVRVDVILPDVVVPKIGQAAEEPKPKPKPEQFPAPLDGDPLADGPKLRVGGFAPVIDPVDDALQTGHGGAIPSAAPEAPAEAVTEFEVQPGHPGEPSLMGIVGFGSTAPSDEAEAAIPDIALEDDAGLADRLWAAREIAEAVKTADGRSRAALYRALGLAYDFAVAAQNDPDDYAELLQESGVKAQARAPMTPIVKLVFGIDYDKTRLTEFASALSYAQRSRVELGGFGTFIEKQPGGLKGLVAAERNAKRPEPKTDAKLEAARAKLREAAPLPLAAIDQNSEFALVVTRRNADGIHEVVALIDDEAMIERAIRRAG